MSRDRIVIVGAGMGGLAAALSTADVSCISPLIKRGRIIEAQLDEARKKLEGQQPAPQTSAPAAPTR